MAGRYNLSEAELEIMEMIWLHEEGLAFCDIMNFFETHTNHSWKKQTLKTFLTRLVAKKALAFVKKGNKCIYFPASPKEDYIQQWSHTILKNDFEGSIKNFMVAITGGSRIDQRELEELKEYIKRLE